MGRIACLAIGTLLIATSALLGEAELRLSQTGVPSESVERPAVGASTSRT